MTLKSFHPEKEKTRSLIVSFFRLGRQSFNHISLVNQANERGKLHPALPVKGATQALMIETFLTIDIDLLS
jgi:hypothetical protein